MVEDEEFEYSKPPPVFLSYQWGVQNEVKLLKQHLNMAGYECWMDIGQMGGGDKLFNKIDTGIRAAKVVICCTTERYAQSPNCNREVDSLLQSLHCKLFILIYLTKTVLYTTRKSLRYELYNYSGLQLASTSMQMRTVYHVTIYMCLLFVVFLAILSANLYICV